MSNRRNIQFTFNPHNKATVLDCSFVVDSTNGNGFGVRSLKKSGRIATVFMHTTTTPGTASNGQVNPNPASGIIVCTLQDNYNTYLGGYSGYASPLTGTPLTLSSATFTVGIPYVIVSLGTTTTAQWQALGVPTFITPAIGVSFIAKATSGAGSGVVESTISAGFDHIESVGDPNVMNNTLSGSIQGFGTGMQFILACYKNTALQAPVDNTVIGLNFYMNDSAQGV